MQTSSFSKHLKFSLVLLNLALPIGWVITKVHLSYILMLPKGPKNQTDGLETCVAKMHAGNSVMKNSHKKHFTPEFFGYFFFTITS